MKYQEKRTVYGRLMFNITLKASRFLMKHMWLYYLLNYTWGILTTIIGWITLGFIKVFLKKKIIQSGKYGPCYYIMLGNNWGGLSLGTNFLVAGNMSDSWTQHTKEHESGHTFQNAIYGPLAIFIIFIPSCIRYWIYTICKIKSDYEAIWFEWSASTIGHEYYSNLLLKK